MYRLHPGGGRRRAVRHRGINLQNRHKSGLDSLCAVGAVADKNAYKVAKEKGEDLDKLLAAANANGRDNARTPMQWDATENAGFSAGTPWLKVNPNYPDVNVEKAPRKPPAISCTP